MVSSFLSTRSVIELGMEIFVREMEIFVREAERK